MDFLAGVNNQFLLIVCLFAQWDNGVLGEGTAETCFECYWCSSGPQAELIFSQAFQMLVETIPVPEAVATPVFPGLPVMAPVLCPEDANAQPIVSELTITGGFCVSIEMNTFYPPSSSGQEEKNVSLSCVMLMPMNKMLNDDATEAVINAAKVAMTPGLIEHGLKQVTKSEQVQVEEVTVKIKVCNDQDKCNTLPLKDKKTLRFEVGSFNPEELFHFFRYRVVVT
ncbi:uncharacterized protein LOC142336587 [Convolutriloba macropyga]|uniref:uncharacterized protein LOC142336587 n=1 Tax=Convolutriloba macropyga TaxID=536237 RepID=UPI003F52453C